MNKSIEDHIDHWIKKQHGSAGWEQKLKNLVRDLIQQALSTNNKEWVERIQQTIEKHEDKSDERFGFAKTFNTMLSKLEDELIHTHSKENL